MAFGAHLVSSGTKRGKISPLGPVQTAHRFWRISSLPRGLLGKPWPCACPGASGMHQKGACVGPEHFPSELVSVRGKNVVEMYSPGTLSRGTEAAARFILSIQRASPILKKRIGLALGEWTGAPSHFPGLMPLFPHLHPVSDARSAVFPPKPANFPPKRRLSSLLVRHSWGEVP